MGFQFFRLFDDQFVEPIKFFIAQPFADINKQTRIEYRPGRKTREPTEVLQVNIFLYHLYGATVIELKLVFYDKGRYNGADVHAFPSRGGLKFLGIDRSQ